MWYAANRFGMANLLFLSLALTGCGRSSAPEVEPVTGASKPPSQATTDPAKDSAQAAQLAILQIRPSKLTTSEWKRAVAELPAVFREGLTGTDEEKARAVGMLAWAFEYENGPILCWIEVGETGQQTVEIATSVLRAYSNPSTKAHGRVLLWLQPRSSSAMRPEIRDRLAKNPNQVPDYFLALAPDDTPVRQWSRNPGFGKPQVPLWFGWGQADLKETSDAVTLKAGAEGTILLLEATEKGVAAPRGAKLVLKAERRNPLYKSPHIYSLDCRWPHRGILNNFLFSSRGVSDGSTIITDSSASKVCLPFRRTRSGPVIDL